jgi:hypothetical protein
MPQARTLQPRDQEHLRASNGPINPNQEIGDQRNTTAFKRFVERTAPNVATEADDDVAPSVHTGATIYFDCSEFGSETI